MSWDDWVRGVEIEPSIYAGDFSRLGEQLTTLLDAGVRIFHFDAGDGHFIEPITIGPIVVKSISPLVHEAGGVLDCHLMVESPEKHFRAFAEALPRVRRSGWRQRHGPLRGVRRPPGCDRPGS